jgi:hypothetical protein
MRLPGDGMLPELNVSTQAVFRTAYGVVLLGTVLWNLLQGRRFFLSERWGGYGQSRLSVDALQNPVCFPILMALWLICATGITLGWGGIWPCLVNVLLCRYYFIAMRWNGTLRGMGAPGYMTYWVGLAVFLLEFTLHYAPELRSLALLVLQVDWAFIMITAGIYKFTAGYPRNEGMELGMVNPQWGTWARLFMGVRPSNPIFWILNQLAWTTEISAGVLMLIPDTRWIGGLLIGVSFIGVGCQIRLNHLTLLLGLTSIIFLSPGSPPEQLLTHWFGAGVAPPVVVNPLLAIFNDALAFGLVGYLLLLPFAYAGLYYNFYGRKKLTNGLQFALECYTNFFGMILWRVFSVNLIDFFIRIHLKPRDGQYQPGAQATGQAARETPSLALRASVVSNYGWGGSARFNHVGESIAITTVFTTLKYYPDNVVLFKERLLRYARTIPCPADSVLAFEYVTIRKTPERFEFIPMAIYTVDLQNGEVSEKLLRQDAPVRTASAVSRVHSASRPGTYAPADNRQEAAHGK